MSTRIRRLAKTLFAVAIMTACGGGGLLITGCQAPGRVLAQESSPICPTCKTETRTSPIKGLTYKKHICPSCRDVEDNTMRGEGDVARTTHVCDRCETIVQVCPMCRAR